jgi:hypothetical protein
VIFRSDDDDVRFVLEQVELPWWCYGLRTQIKRGNSLIPCQFKDYQINICCFSAKHATLRSKNKD